MLEEHTRLLFIMNEHTLKRLWEDDSGYRIFENTSSSYMTMSISLKWWNLFADPYKWDEFILQPENFTVLQRIEQRSQK